MFRNNDEIHFGQKKKMMKFIFFSEKVQVTHKRRNRCFLENK